MWQQLRLPRSKKEIKAKRRELEMLAAVSNVQQGGNKRKKNKIQKERRYGIKRRKKSHDKQKGNKKRLNDKLKDREKALQCIMENGFTVKYINSYLTNAGWCVLFLQQLWVTQPYF